MPHIPGMNVLELALAAVQPILLTAITGVVSTLAVPVFRWFRDNSNNTFVRLLANMVSAVVSEVEQTGARLDGMGKMARAHATVVSRLSPQRKRVEKVTGTTLEQYAKTEIENQVMRMNLRNPKKSP